MWEKARCKKKEYIYSLMINDGIKGSSKPFISMQYSPHHPRAK